MFSVCAAITLFGGIFYVLFCDADLQSWAVNRAPEETDSDNEDVDENGGTNKKMETCPYTDTRF